MTQIIERQCSTAPIEFGRRIRRWRLKKLRVAVANIIQGANVTPMQFIETLDKAIEIINSVCGIELDRSGSIDEANVVIRSGSGQADQLDGPGGTLAYAYLPRSDREDGQLELVMDVDEGWTSVLDKVLAGALKMLLPVLLHELLHILGLEHDDEHPDALMAPRYNPDVITLTEHDIRRLQALYGPPRRRRTPTPEVKRVEKVVIHFADGTTEVR